MEMQLIADDTCSTSSAVSTSSSSTRYRTVSDQMNSRSRPRSTKWSGRKKPDSLALSSELDYCSSPDSAVVTASESLGSSESIDSLDDCKQIIPPPPKAKVSPPKRKNNRRYRRWCQMKRDSVDSGLSTESSSSTSSSSSPSSPGNTVKKTEVKKVSVNKKPLAVVRNTLHCPLIFPPGSYPPDQITTLPYYMPYFPAYPPPSQLLAYPPPYHLQLLNRNSPLSRNVTIDLTGHDVSYSVENLPPIIPPPPPPPTSQHHHSRSLSNLPRNTVRRHPPRPLMEISTALFPPSSPFMLPYPRVNWPHQCPSGGYHHHQHPQPHAHVPYVYIPAPLRVPRALDPCQSLKTCAVPFSEFPTCEHHRLREREDCLIPNLFQLLIISFSSLP